MEKMQFEWIAVDFTLHDLINEEIAWVQIMAHRRKMLNPQPKQNVLLLFDSYMYHRAKIWYSVNVKYTLKATPDT